MHLFGNLGVKKNLSSIFNHGALKGTKNIFIYAIDQGFELGPALAFSKNEKGYDPLYHFKFAVESGASAIAGPLGFLQTGAPHFIGQIPMILKLNNGNRLMNKERNAPNQAITGSVQQALKLGCAGVGFTIYPGSDESLSMYSEIQKISEEAQEYGLFTVIWAYPRGNMKHERALDVIAYGAHMACLLNAHIVKIKMPEPVIDQFHEAYKNIPYLTKKDRVQHIMNVAFNHQRYVLFSGGEEQEISNLLDDIKAIKEGGGTGSIIGRNLFQRPFEEAIALAQEIVKIYKNT